MPIISIQAIYAPADDLIDIDQATLVRNSWYLILIDKLGWFGHLDPNFHGQSLVQPICIFSIPKQL